MDYVATFGKREAPVSIVKNLSLSCEACLKFIRRDFPYVERYLIDTGQVCWHFQLAPYDHVTIHAMNLHYPIDQRQAFIKELEHFLPHPDLHNGIKHIERYRLDQGRIPRSIKSKSLSIQAPRYNFSLTKSSSTQFFTTSLVSEK